MTNNTKHTAESLTKEQIKALRDEDGAGQAQVAAANAALMLVGAAGRSARTACANILNDRAAAPSRVYWTGKANACIAIDPVTGCMVREATDAETRAYFGRPQAPAFRTMVRVGDVFIDEDAGPGLWFGGAGF